MALGKQVKPRLKRPHKKRRKPVIKTLFCFFLFLLCTWTVSTIKHPIFNTTHFVQSWRALPKTEWKPSKKTDRKPTAVHTHPTKIIHTRGTQMHEKSSNKLMLHTACQQTKAEAKSQQKKLNKLNIHSQLRSQIENQHTCFYLSLGPYQDFPSLQRQQQILQKLKDSPSINIRR